MHFLKHLLVASAIGAASVAAAADLYAEDQFRALVSDVRAHKVGDNLTIMVLETSSAASTADTNSKRNTEAGIGGTVDVGRVNSTGQVSANVNSDFNGAARTQRAGKLLAQITVKVTQVAPNGDLDVAGEQVVEINEEKQLIRVEGKVRPQDVAENNTVLSTRLADAKIQYVGDGVLAEGQRPGWITRFLIWLGL